MGWAKYDEDIREIVEERSSFHAYCRKSSYIPSDRQPYPRSSMCVGTSEYSKNTNK